MDWLYPLAIVVSSIAAILAWIAKLLWSKEYKESTNRIIEAKDAEVTALKTQISTLQELNSEKLREILIATKYALENEIDRLRHIIREKDNEIALLPQSGQGVEKIRILANDKSQSEDTVLQLENALFTLKEAKYRYIDVERLLGRKEYFHEIVRKLTTAVRSIEEQTRIDRLCFIGRKASSYGLISLKGLLSRETGIESFILETSPISRVPDIQKGENIVVVDDVITSGIIMERSVSILREKGALIEHVVVIYGDDHGICSLQKYGIMVSALFSTSDFHE